MDALRQPPVSDESQFHESLLREISFKELIENVDGFIRRQYPIFLFVIGLSLVLGLLYVFTAPARYTAHAMLMIDSSKARAFEQQQATIADAAIDAAQVETQVEVLKSDTIGLSVVKDLHLAQDPEFVKGDGGILSAIRSFVSKLLTLGSAAPVSDNAETRNALNAILAGRSISRVGRTYVLDIAYTALSPNRAAQIANAIADAYIVDQLEAKYQTTKRASAWLQDRIKELRAQAMAADRAVVEYKQKNNIVDVGGNGNNPRLLADQQVSELNTQLITARASVAEAKARFERIQEVMKEDVPDAGVADSLRSDVIVRLRNQYLDIAARERIFSARYGATHLAVVNLRTQMAELRRSIADELGRIAESYKSDYEIAKVRVQTLENGLNAQITDAQVTNRERVGLRELESTAQVYHTIHDNFLQRYMEAIQQQSFPISESRVLSAAAPPAGKSSPRLFLSLALALAFGMAASAGIALFREALDRAFRTTRQVEQILNANCLAVLPKLGEPASAQQLAVFGLKQPSKRPQSVGSIYRFVVAEPLSQFTESFRSIKVAADINSTIKENRVIGVTSSLPGEGKSTISSNLAQLMAHAGKRVLLLDADLRNPSLTRNLKMSRRIGLLEVLSGENQLREALSSDKETGLHFLPAVVDPRLFHTNEVLASQAFKRLMQAFRQEYDYIVVDLSPLAPVVDVRSTIGTIDSYLFVVEWGRTQVNVVQHQLRSNPEIYERLLGVVLNKADVKVIQRYEYGYGTYYHKHYSEYGSAA